MVRNFYNKRVNVLTRCLYCGKFEVILVYLAAICICWAVGLFLFKDGINNFTVLEEYRYLTGFLFKQGVLSVCLASIFLCISHIIKIWKSRFHKSLSAIVERLNKVGVVDIRAIGLTFTKREIKSLMSGNMDRFGTRFTKNILDVVPGLHYKEFIVVWRSVKGIDEVALLDYLGVEISDSSSKFNYFKDVIYSWSGAKLEKVKR